MKFFSVKPKSILSRLFGQKRSVNSKYGTDFQSDDSGMSMRVWAGRTDANRKLAVEKFEKRRFDIQKENEIDIDILEAMPFECIGSATEVAYETDEFTSVCPWSGLPDFARLVIRYIPDNEIVELKSLKYYLTSYRNVGILQEHTVNRILQDLVQLLRPVSMAVEAEYKERGGIKTKAAAKYQKENI